MDRQTDRKQTDTTESIITLATRVTTTKTENTVQTEH